MPVLAWDAFLEQSLVRLVHMSTAACGLAKAVRGWSAAAVVDWEKPAGNAERILFGKSLLAMQSKEQSR